MITEDSLAPTGFDDGDYSVIIVCNKSIVVERGEYVLHDYAHRVALATIICIIFMIGIFGNSLVVVAVTLSRRLQDTTNVFVVNLAVANLVTCLLLPVHAGTLLHKGSCHIPDLFCKFVAALTLTTVGCSIISMALIALYRYHLIRSNMNPKTTLLDIFKKRILIATVTFSWLYPVLLMSIFIPAGVGSLGYSLQYKVCSQDSANDSSDYLSLTAGLLVQFPAFLIIIVCYSLILRFVRNHDRNLAKIISPSVHSTSTLQSDTEVEVSVDHVDDASGCPNQSPSQHVSCHPVQHSSNSVQGASSSLPEISSPSSPISTHGSKSVEGITSHVPSPVQVPTCNVLENHTRHLSDLSSDTRPTSTETTASDLDNTHVQVVLRSVSGKPKTASSSPGQVLNLDRISAIKLKQLYKKQLRITKNLFIIVCAYTLCVIPLGIAVLIPSSDPVIPWFTVILLSSCCLNPIIYALKHPTFSEVFACILRCRLKNIPEPSQLVRYIRGCRSSS